MTVIPCKAPAQAVLLDIEGTTTPIDFVTQTLFPYARRHVKSFLTRRLLQDDVRTDLNGLCAEQAADLNSGLNPPQIRDDPPETLIESAVTYIHWLMDRDRKSTPLKSLQGKIWEEGYQQGELKSQVFPDTPRALERWRGQNRRVFIYSSGSVLAQKLLFAHTSAGDLTRLIDGYFDTLIGAKKEGESYRRIAETLRIQPAEIVFISDVAAELDAARSAGLQTVLAVRPGNLPQALAGQHISVTTFDEIFP
jgi:enolase-phosphatase E1